MSVRLLEQCLRTALGGDPSPYVYGGTCGDQLAMEHGGTVYACDSFVDPGFEFGLNYLCAGYRTFFRYVQPYLELSVRTAREGKPLAFAMDEVAVRDDHASTTRA